MTEFDEFEPKTEEDKLDKLTEMANELLGLRETIEKLTATLKSLQAEEQQLSMVDLPEAMKEARLTSFALDTGQEVKVQHKVKASITKARKEAAHKWLRENGFGALIKEKRIVEESVHHQTLGAFAREQLSKGNPLPECFSIYEYDQTEIK